MAAGRSVGRSWGLLALALWRPWRALWGVFRGAGVLGVVPGAVRGSLGPLRTSETIWGFCARQGGCVRA